MMTGSEKDFRTLGLVSLARGASGTTDTVDTLHDAPAKSNSIATEVTLLVAKSTKNKRKTPDEGSPFEPAFLVSGFDDTYTTTTICSWKQIATAMGCLRTRTLGRIIMPKTPRHLDSQILKAEWRSCQFKELLRKMKNYTKLFLNAIAFSIVGFSILGLGAIRTSQGLQIRRSCQPNPASAELKIGERSFMRIEESQIFASLNLAAVATGCVLIGIGLGNVLALNLISGSSQKISTAEQEALLCRDAFLGATSHDIKNYSLWLSLNKPTLTADELTCADKLRALNKWVSRKLLTQEQAITAVEWVLALDSSELIFTSADWDKLSRNKEFFLQTPCDEALKQIAALKKLGWVNSTVYRVAAIQMLWKGCLINEYERQVGINWVKSM